MKVEAGKIEIVLSLAEDGDEIIEHTVSGDLPVVTQIGLLEMTKDTILRGGDDELPS